MNRADGKRRYSLSKARETHGFHEISYPRDVVDRSPAGITQDRIHRVSGKRTASESQRSVARFDTEFNGDGLEFKSNSESVWKSFRQIFLPFMMANVGSMMAGIILEEVEPWQVFRTIREFIIVAPAMIGLKGDVEMALASRLSTRANLGQMDVWSARTKMIVGNMVLVQCQASTVGTLAPLVAMALNSLNTSHEPYTVKYVVVLLAATVTTANLANIILGSTMCAVVVLARRYRVNPDNIATPIAASLGDGITMGIMAIIAYMYWNWFPLWLVGLILVVLILLTPLWGYLARKNPYTREVIFTGWFPVLLSMFIANGGGWVMEKAIDKFERIKSVQPIVNGIVGDLVSIQSSRMSTHLHRSSVHKELPPSDPVFCPIPFYNFFGKSAHRNVARVLLFITGPSHLIFLLLIQLINGVYDLNAYFILTYLITNVILVAVTLYMGYCLVQLIWYLGANPDNSAIPILTGVADFMGSGFLWVAFTFLQAINDPNAQLVSEGSSLNETTVAVITTTSSSALFYRF